MAGEDGRTVRDVKNHLLFEIATEVAHRGKQSSPPCQLEATKSSEATR